MGLDLLEYIDLLGQEKFRAIILHAPPIKSPELNKYANKLLSYKNSTGLDLLAYFLENHQVASYIDRFGPEQLKALLLEKIHGYRFISHLSP